MKIPERNFMIEVNRYKKVKPDKFYPDGNYNYSTGYLHQKHPCGYNVDYFSNLDECEEKIKEVEKGDLHELGYWNEYTIFELKLVAEMKS